MAKVDVLSEKNCASPDMDFCFVLVSSEPKTGGSVSTVVSQ